LSARPHQLDEARAVNGKIHCSAGVFQLALLIERHHALRGDAGKAWRVGAQVRRWIERIVRRSHEIRKTDIRPFESRRVEIGDVVGDDIESFLLGFQPDSADFEGLVHFETRPKVEMDWPMRESYACTMRAPASAWRSDVIICSISAPLSTLADSIMP